LSGYQFVDDEKMKEAGAYSARHLPGATTNALRNDSALPFAVDKPLSTDRNVFLPIAMRMKLRLRLPECGLL